MHERKQTLAHSFEIRAKDCPTNTEHLKIVYPGGSCTIREFQAPADGYCAFFFGYCNAIMYTSFGMNHHDAVVTGDGSTETITREIALSGLDSAIARFETADFPDYRRIDDLIEFRSNMDTLMKDTSLFQVHYF